MLVAFVAKRVFCVQVDEISAAPAGSGGLYVGMSLQSGEAAQYQLVPISTSVFVFSCLFYCTCTAAYRGIGM